jgi:hypothetical protein
MAESIPTIAQSASGHTGLTTLSIQIELTFSSFDHLDALLVVE